MESIDYNEIIARVLTGDTSAYDLLIERLTGNMIRFALSILRDGKKAEEAVEDAFVECFLHLRSLEDRNAFEGWLATTVKRKCWRLSKTSEYEDISEMLETLESGESAPEDYLIRKEDESTVRAAIRRLPQALREATKLYYLDGCSVKETAASLGVPESTVKRRLHDARTKLKKELIDYMEKPTNSIENEIKEKIKKIRKYRALYGVDDTYQKSVEELTPLITGVEDEKIRKYYEAEQLSLKHVKDPKKRKELQKEYARVAEAGEHPKALANKFINDSYEKFDMGDDLPKKRAEYLENTALPALEKCKDLPGYEEAYGLLLMYISRNINKYDLDKSVRLLEQALDCYGEDDFYKSVIKTALETYKESCKRSALPDMGMEDAACRLGVSSKGIRMSNSWDNLILHQPIVQKNYLDSPFFPSYLADSDQMILYTDKKPGDVVDNSRDLSEDGSGDRIVRHVIQYLSDDESVTVPAGTFERCTHIKKKYSRWYSSPEETEAWFSEDVGVVKYSLSYEDRTDVYELTEYDLRGGKGLLPLCVGNRWVYREKDVPKALESWHEYRVSHVTSDGKFFDLSHIGLTYVPKAEDRGLNIPDSDVCLAIVDKLCRKWKLDEALSYLRAAIRANTSEKAVAAAICGAHFLEKFAEYQKRGYRFLPSGLRSENVAVNEHTVKETTGTEYSFYPSRYGWRGKYEDRIFGVKPFRYLNRFTDCYWNDEWKPGFTQEIPCMDYHNNKTTVYMSVEDGGTVALPCGTFENCLKVTFEAEMPGEHPEHYYLNWNDGYEYQWCGKKEYWFAPGVGIVRHVCTWGNHISSEMILNSYDVPGSDGKEYFPLYIGTRWEYVETHLTEEGYRAAFCVSVPNGFDGKYQWIQSQEFVYLGTEEEYKKKFFGK